MASVNPAFQLQAVTQYVSLGTGWDCGRGRLTKQGRYVQIQCSMAQCKSLLPSDQKTAAVICGLPEHSRPEINSKIIHIQKPFLCLVSWWAKGINLVIKRQHKPQFSSFLWRLFSIWYVSLLAVRAEGKWFSFHQEVTVLQSNAINKSVQQPCC